MITLALKLLWTNPVDLNDPYGERVSTHSLPIGMLLGSTAVLKQSEIATAQAVIATAQAVISTAQAGTSTTQAGISTAKAVIATDKAVLTAADRVQTGLDATATAADRVQTGLDRAQTTADAAASVLARDAALIQAGVYTTEALGRAAVADGQAFKVQGAGAIAAYEYRRTNSTTSVLIATYPSKSYVDSKADTVVGKNLFNPSDSGVLVGYYVSPTTGLPVAAAGFRVSGYIPVSASTAYAVSSGRQMAWYDSSYVFISGVSIGTAAPATATSPAGAVYLRVSISDGDLSTYQVETGPSSTAYEAYTVTAKLSDASVTSAKIASAAITTAKLANDAVTPAKTNFLQIGKNKFNKAAVTTGSYITDAGLIYANATYDISDYIPVVVGTAYICNGSGIRFSCYFDANYNVIAGGTGTNTFTFTPPSGAVYIRVSMYHANINTFQLEIGATATTYEQYQYVLLDPAGIPFGTSLADSQVTTEKVANLSITTAKIASTAVTPAKTNFMQIGKNKFNKNTVTSGYYLTNTGSVLSSATYDISDYIPVVAGTTYVNSGVLGIRFSCYFDANLNVIAGGTNTNVFTFTPPVGAVYVRVTVYHSDLNAFQLEIGATSTTYEQYRYVLLDPAGIPIGIDGITAAVTPVLVMPPTIYGVQGRECNLYIDNLHVGDSSVYAHDVTNTAANGAQQRERWTWTPTGEQTTGTLTVSAYDKTSGAVLVSATTNQRAAASTAGSGTTKTINTIGDSLINANTILQTVIDIASTDVMSVTMIGTRGTGANKHEGRGGWSITDFSTVGRTFYSFTVSGVVTLPLINSTTYTNNGSTFKVQELSLVAGSGTIICERTAGTNAPSASGTLTKSSGTGDATIAFSSSSAVSGNPFWIGGALNYAQYLTNNSLATPDWVVIHLGINDAFGYTTDATVTAAAIAAFVNLDQLIASIKAAGVKVALMIPTPPASQDGFGAAYGTGQTAWRDKRNIMLWAKELIAKYTGQEASRIYLVPSNTALDVVNGYPLLAAAPVNSRSSVTIQRQSNGVHPDTSGYQQIGDCLWAFLKCN